ncbi:MAG TPA: nitroreductase family protein, partial [Fimbriimonadaceae bacterium]|nr:nitroreductase family protein [Fimbriimonadaceae bacterium]
MEVSDAIRNRRAVREYVDQPVREETVRALIEAATLAPSAVNGQPWAFVVVQDRDLLKKISDRSKLLMLHADYPAHISSMIADPAFNIFYNAGTLIVICAKPGGEHSDWDCCLAGENLMLAARDMGLGTCTIGLAWPALELSEIKSELGIPAGYEAILP